MVFAFFTIAFNVKKTCTKSAKAVNESLISPPPVEICLCVQYTGYLTKHHWINEEV